MTFEEALTGIMEELPIEKFDEHINVIKESVQNVSRETSEEVRDFNSDVEEWKGKYEELKKKYISRFEENFMSNPVVEDNATDTISNSGDVITSDEVGEVDIEDLDWNASSE